MKAENTHFWSFLENSIEKMNKINSIIYGDKKEFKAHPDYCETCSNANNANAPKYECPNCQDVIEENGIPCYKCEKPFHPDKLHKTWFGDMCSDCLRASTL